jgi:hypothetical protein
LSSGSFYLIESLPIDGDSFHAVVKSLEMEKVELDGKDKTLCLYGFALWYWHPSHKQAESTVVKCALHRRRGKPFPYVLSTTLLCLSLGWLLS